MSLWSEPGPSVAAGRFAIGSHQLLELGALGRRKGQRDGMDCVRVDLATTGKTGFELVQAVLLGGRLVIGASRELRGGKANYWRTELRPGARRVGGS